MPPNAFRIQIEAHRSPGVVQAQAGSRYTAAFPHHLFQKAARGGAQCLPGRAENALGRAGMKVFERQVIVSGPIVPERRPRVFGHEAGGVGGPSRFRRQRGESQRRMIQILHGRRQDRSVGFCK